VSAMLDLLASVDDFANFVLVRPLDEELITLTSQGKIKCCFELPTNNDVRMSSSSRSDIARLREMVIMFCR
jgi:hypothetical protein